MMGIKQNTACIMLSSTTYLVCCTILNIQYLSSDSSLRTSCNGISRVIQYIVPIVSDDQTSCKLINSVLFITESHKHGEREVCIYEHIECPNVASFTSGL